MASPTVRAYATPTNGTDALPAFAVTLPAGVQTGDLLIAWAACDATNSAWTASPGNGWVRLTDETSAVNRTSIYAKIASGTDGLSIASSNNNDYSVNVVAITVGTHGVTDVTTDLVIPAAATGASGNADPPASGTVASKDWLALAMCAVDMTATTDAITAYPSGYSAGVLTKSVASTTSVGNGIGHRALTAATSENPGTFTNTSRAWMAQTILVPDPVVATDHSRTQTDPVGILDTIVRARTAHRSFTDGVGVTDVALASDSPYVAEVLADSPVGYWRLGEASGTTALDFAGANHNGSYVGTPTFGLAGAVGDGDTSVGFSGDDRVDVAAINTGTSITVEAWIYPTAYPTSGTDAVIMHQLTTDPWIVRLMPDGSVEGYIFFSGTVQAYVSSAEAGDPVPVPLNEWTHIAYVFDNVNDSVHLYINGVEEVAVPALIAYSPSAVPRELGIGGKSGTTRFFVGRIDEAAFYTSALTATRIAAHYDAAVSTGSSFAVTFTDTIGISDSATPAKTISLTVTDPVGITDTAATQMTGADLATITDPIGLTDTAARSMVMARGPPGSSAVLFSDEFNGPDGTAVLPRSGYTQSGGDGWTFYNPSGTSAGIIYTFQDSHLVRSLSGDGATGDWSIVVPIKSNSNLGNVIFGYTDADNFLLWAQVVSESKVKLYKQVAGSFTLLGEAAYTFPNDAFSTFRVDRVGNEIRAYVNDVLRVTHTLTGGELAAFGDGYGIWEEDVDASATNYESLTLSSIGSGDQVGITDTVTAGKAISVTVTDPIGVDDSGSTLHWSLYADGVSATPGASVSGLTPGTDYYFYVEAINAEGTSGPSNIAGPCSPVSGGETVADDIGLDDTVALTRDVSRTVTDTVGVTDSQTVAEDDAVTTTDNVGILDTVTRVHAITRTVTDGVGITDTATASLSRATSDGIGILDTVTAARTISRAVTDTVGLTDAATHAKTIAVTVTDSVGIDDTTTRVHDVSRTFTDDVGITDSSVVAEDDAVTISDNVGILDTATRTHAAVRSFTDTVGITDTATPAKAITVTVTDDIGITDTATPAKTTTATVTDGIGILDATDRVHDVTRTVTDPVGVTDSTATNLQGADSVEYTDEVGILDTVTRAHTAIRSFTDTVGISDTATPAKAITVTVTDDIGITDTATPAKTIVVTITDDIGVTDTATPAKTVTVTVTDGIGILDETTLTRVVVRAVTDTIGLADTAATTLQSATGVTASDPIGITDTVVTTATAVRSSTDTVGISDTATPAKTITVAVTDDIGISDTAVPGRTVTVTVTDQIGIIDDPLIVGAPAAITDLSCDPGPGAGEITLSWTAPVGVI